jgi:glycosyltransferase involved in cell wall biosynthesis
VAPHDAPIRVALVRGSNLNPFELANFEMPADVVAFGSRRGAFLHHGIDLPTVLLRSPDDVLSRLPWPVPQAVARFAGSQQYLVGLEQALRGFDIAHVAELSNPYSLQAIRARERRHCRRVVATAWENVPLPHYPNHRVARRARAVARAVDHFLAISERARLHLELAGVGRERITVLPIGIDTERFSPRGARVGDELRILSVSRLVREKGVEDLLIAFGLLVRGGVRARLRVVGEGPLRTSLERLAAELGVADRVELDGSVKHDELPAVYRDSDLFVLASAPLASWREQFGIAVVEAMASGLPVIVGHSGSLDEVVADADSVVPPHDPFALHRKLATLAADPDARHARGRRNREWVLERFDRRQVAASIHNVYRAVLDDRPSPS